MDREILKKIVELEDKGEEFLIATVVKVKGSSPGKIGAKALITRDKKISGTIGGGRIEKMVIDMAPAIIDEGVSKTLKFSLTHSGEPVKKDEHLGNSFKTEMLCGGEVEIFFEVYKKPVKLCICGAGHIGQAISKLADFFGWQTLFIDTRKEFVEKIRKAGHPAILARKYDQGFSKKFVDKNTAIVIVTHAHIGDMDCLIEALKTPAFYIGMIGSKAKVKMIFKKLKEKDIKIDDRVYAPVGLDLAGGSPQEIAFCIIAEILKIKNKKSGKHLKLKMTNDK